MNEIEQAFRAGFLAGTSFGMDQCSDDGAFSNAPDENQAFEKYRHSADESAGASTTEGK